MLSLLSWFHRKTPAVSTPVLTQEPLSGDQVRAYLKAKLRENTQTDHITLQAAARLFFNVDLPTSLWRLRYAQDSLLYFRIYSVSTVFQGEELTNIRLSLCDESLNTSLTLKLNLEDVPELLVPVFPPMLKSPDPAPPLA